MSQFTITLDDDLLQAAHAYARQHGQALEALVARLLAEAVRPARSSRKIFRARFPRVCSVCSEPCRCLPISIIKKLWSRPSRSVSLNEKLIH